MVGVTQLKLFPDSGYTFWIVTKLFTNNKKDKKKFNEKSTLKGRMRFNASDLNDNFHNRIIAMLYNDETLEKICQKFVLLKTTKLIIYSFLLLYYIIININKCLCSLAV